MRGARGRCADGGWLTVPGQGVEWKRPRTQPQNLGGKVIIDSSMREMAAKSLLLSNSASHVDNQCERTSAIVTDECWVHKMERPSCIPCVRCLLPFIFPIFYGCAQTLPNTKPFVETSTALAKASDSGYKSLNSMFTTIADLEKTCDDERTRKLVAPYKQPLKDLEAVEAAHLAVIKALSNYTVRLDQIVQSAENEKVKIEKVHSAFDTTLNAVKANSAVAGPYAPAVAAAADVARIVNKIVEAARKDLTQAEAVDSLSKELDRTGNSILQMNKLLKDDLKGMVDMTATKPYAFVAAFETCHEGDFKYWHGLNKTRKYMIDKTLNSGFVGEGGDRHWSYSSMTSENGFGKRTDATILQHINEDMIREAVHYDPIRREEQDTIERFNGAAQLLKLSSETIEELGKAHKELGLQIQAGMQVDFTALAAYASRLLELANAVSEFKAKS